MNGAHSRLFRDPNSMYRVGMLSSASWKSWTIGKSFVRCLCIASIFGFLGLWARASELRPPNIVWINCEDLGPALGCYGDASAITPNIDALAEDGILYRNAFANAPICAPARSCLITGVYPTAMGSQHLRCEAPPPNFIQPFPNYLKEAGYFVTNYAKTDYNFSADGIYDYWKKDFAPWRRREGDEPFFSFFVLGATHEGPANFRDRYEEIVADLPSQKRHDPKEAVAPPYFPNTPKMQELWARYDDLVSALDEQVGEIIAGLKSDGLWDNTIVWFFSDHGHGLPRHKRWLMDSGLRVPFIVRIPEAYQDLASGMNPGSLSRRLVSFVDFAPTTLSLAGLQIPEHMRGSPFLGTTLGEPRGYVFGARDRADDLFEISRAVSDGRYIYIRHFLPHLPYIQAGRIMGNQKESMAELRRARDAGELDANSLAIFAERKPVEEFYDLFQDPFEMNNLAEKGGDRERMNAMREALRGWMLSHRDTGMLCEAEYHLRARESEQTIYEYAQDRELYDLERVLSAAELATTNARREDLVSMLGDSDSGVRYWGAVGWLARDLPLTASAVAALEFVLDDTSPSVAIAAAETLCRRGQARRGLPTLSEYIADERPWVALQAARSIVEINTAASPLVERIEFVRSALEGTEGQRRYKDFNYASFTGWALETALIQCGVASTADFN